MKTSAPTAGITTDRANLPALAVVRLAHFGVLAQAIVAVGFRIAAADRSNDGRLADERTNDRDPHTGALDVGNEACAGRLLAEFVRSAFQSGEAAACRSDLGAGAVRQSDRESECEGSANCQQLPHQIL